ncbi:MAG: FAD-binding protein, partial [Magnetococcales bacterium]|nr:FAD-binding protein [Magnetococcales bacterium]
VRPTVHYSMGGIRTDKYGAAPLPGLFAAGEAACVSVHGSNRLGGNSLLDTIVFGKITGAHASKYAKSAKLHDFPADALGEVEERVRELKARPDRGLRPATLHHDMAESMNAWCGVYREVNGIATLADKFAGWRKEYERIHLDDKSQIFNVDLLRAIELRNLLDLGECIVKGALARQESRGAHFRIDFPNRDDANWRKHTLAFWDEAGQTIRLDTEAVRTVGNPEYTPKERTY